MESAANKTERFLQLEQLLLAHPSGIRKAEIARRLGVHRSTAARYVDELGSLLPITEDPSGLIGINRDSYLNHIRLTIHESLSVYLACRLMADRMDRFNPHSASAVRKLGQSLHGFSPTIASQIVSEAEKFENPRARKDPVYLDVLETLTRGWSQSLYVDVVHHSVHRGTDDPYRLAVYSIVPYAVGQTVQVIGQCTGEDHMRTLRVDRIRKASLTSVHYEKPDDVHVGRMLENSWGIWYSETEPVLVELRFSSQVAHRVRETVWHTSQELVDLPDGRLLWHARISEPKEMIPWIRGWGADVEAIAPDDLRRKLKEEAEALRKVYWG